MKKLDKKVTGVRCRLAKVALKVRNLVIVHRVNTDRKGKMVSEYQIGRLLWHILDAAGESDI